MLVTRTHVFTYSEDDGDACIGIAHRVPRAERDDCDTTGCDDWHDRRAGNLG